MAGVALALGSFPWFSPDSGEKRGVALGVSFGAERNGSALGFGVCCDDLGPHGCPSGRERETVLHM